MQVAEEEAGRRSSVGRGVSGREEEVWRMRRVLVLGRF